MAEIKNLDRLNDWICPAPFNDLMILHNEMSVCCPEWTMEHPPIRMHTNLERQSLRRHWYGEYLTNLRKTVSDGSYSMCKKETCPRIQHILNMSDEEWVNWKNGPEALYRHELHVRSSPRLVYLNFDEACNLKCPTCRLGLITNQNNINKSAVPVLLETFEREFAKEVEIINLDGAGDVFYSKTFREWLQNFDPLKYPQLKKLALITNGQLFNEKMWNSMPTAQPYMKDLFVSIDAASKETYEQIRLGGDWDILMDNVEFWTTLPLDHIGFNFVAQKKNQHEIYDFFIYFYEKFMMSTFRGQLHFEMTLVENWGHLDLDSYEALLPDEDVVKAQMAKLKPYTRWVHSNLW